MSAWVYSTGNMSINQLTSKNAYSCFSCPTHSLGKVYPGISLFANYSQDARIICRNFNQVWGCTLHKCNFAIICNRMVNGKACGQSHPFNSHPGGGPGAPQGQGFSATSS